MLIKEFLEKNIYSKKKSGEKIRILILNVKIIQILFMLVALIAKLIYVKFV
jgi:hypothetical protein